MISSNMTQLAATAHQRELHRAAAEYRSTANHSGETAPLSRRALVVITRMLHPRAGRRTQRGNTAPRLSI